MDIKFWSHQEQMIRFAIRTLEQRGYAWWYAGCRVGKTAASLGVAEALGAKRTLVLTRKAAIRNAWQHDLDAYAPDMRYVLLDSQLYTHERVYKSVKSSKQKATKMRELDAQIVVVNYETARIIADDLKAMQFDFVIADESHSLKSHNSKQSLALAKALANVPYKLAMTGTGWDDRPTDVYGQVRWLDPVIVRGRPVSKLLKSWTAFYEHFVNYYTMDNIKIARSYKNLDELQHKLDPFTLVVDSEKVLDLPEAHHIKVELAMPKVMTKVYRELEEELIVEIGEDVLTVDNKLVLALRLHQLTSGAYPTDEGVASLFRNYTENPKLMALWEIIEELGGKPLVVFTRFSYDVEVIAAMLKNKGVSYKKLVGGLHEHNEWQAGEGQVLIANIQAGGTGISLNRARYCVYYSIGHSRTDYEQSLWRIRAQHDATKPVSYWQLCIANSIDTEIMTALEGKGEVSDYLLSGLTNRLTQ